MDYKNLVPMDGFAIIEREQSKNKTTGGLFIPDNAQEKRAIGHIVALPIDGYPDLSVGDRVVFLPFAGKDIVISDKELVVIDCESIEAKLE